MPTFDEAHQRHAQHYLNVLYKADDLYIHGGKSVVFGLTLFDLEWSNIRAGQAWAAMCTESMKADAIPLCNLYPSAGRHCLLLHQHPREQILWLGSAIISAQCLNDRRAESRHLGFVGIAHKNLGDVRQAIQFYEQALVIARETNDRGSEEAILSNLGNAYIALGETKQGIEFLGQAMTIAREIGDRRGEGEILSNFGAAYKEIGEPHRAIEHPERALNIVREVGNRRNEGAALSNLGIS